MKRYLLVALTFAAVFAIFFSCNLFNLGDAVGYVPAYSQVVGPEGGTVTDGRGALVVIPEGALAEETTITIASYQNAADVFKNHGVTPFQGGAAFGPAGTEFLKPVKITLPTASMCPAGQEQALFLYNTSTESWDQTDTGCTADEGGTTVSAEVTHFSSYVMSLFPPDAMSTFASFFDGNDGASALTAYAGWFLRTSGIYGYKTECGEATHEVIGVHFSITYQVDGASGSDAYVHGGSSDDTHTSISYQYDYTSSAGKEINYDLLITLHWKVTGEEPEREMFVSLTEPVAGATVEGLQNISAFTVGGSETIGKVEFFVDGISVGSDTEAPYGITWDASGYAAGEYTVKATATSTGGETADSEEVAVNVGEEDEEDDDEVYASGEAQTFTAGSVSFNMHYVPGGAFPTGVDDDGSATVGSFWVGETEVTNELAAAVFQWAFDEGKMSGGTVDSTIMSLYGQNLISLEEAQINFSGGTFLVDPGLEQYPCIEINWYGAIMFCNWLTEMVYGTSDEIVYSGMEDGWIDDETLKNNSRSGFRLPSSDEWECAARYINGSSWNYGDHVSGDLSGACYDDDDILGGMGMSTVFGNYAWYGDNSDIDPHSGWSGQGTHPVGTAGNASGNGIPRTGNPNHLGIFDMSGNVFEWCFTEDGSNRVLRGSCWNYSAELLRVGLVRSRVPHIMSQIRGLRVFMKD